VKRHSLDGGSGFPKLDKSPRENNLIKSEEVLGDTAEVGKGLHIHLGSDEKLEPLRLEIGASIPDAETEWRDASKQDNPNANLNVDYDRGKLQGVNTDSSMDLVAHNDIESGSERFLSLKTQSVQGSGHDRVPPRNISSEPRASLPSEFLRAQIQNSG
jgi:hypothetical protein